MSEAESALHGYNSSVTSASECFKAVWYQQRNQFLNDDWSR